MSLYPTKEEIMAEPLPEIKPETVGLILDWKRTVWANTKKADNQAKARELACKSLAEALLLQANLKAKVVILNNEQIIPFWSPQHKILAIKSGGSIISTLHEFAHALLGNSELKACRWSYSAFKWTFPKALNRLVWKGHMLIKPKK